MTTVRTFSIRAGLAASTVTPGSTAPDSSFTAPAIVPLDRLWACAATASSRTASAKATERNACVFMVASPYFVADGEGSIEVSVSADSRNCL